MNRGLTVTACLLCLLATEGAPATKRPRPPTLTDLATVWVGEEPRGGLEFFRLELDEEGVGILVVQWLPGGRADAYQVNSTRLDGELVEFGLQPVDRQAEPIYLRGRATQVRLSLEVGDVARGWTRTTVLERYDELLARLSAVNQRAQQYQSRTKK